MRSSRALSPASRAVFSVSIAVLLSATSFTSPPVLSPTVVLRSFTSFLRPLSPSPTADSSLLIFSVLLRMFFAFVLMFVAFVLMFVAFVLMALSAPALVYTSTAVADPSGAGSTLVVSAAQAKFGLRRAAATSMAAASFFSPFPVVSPLVWPLAISDATT